MILNITDKKLNIESLDNQNKKVLLENIQVYVEEGTDDEYITLGDMLCANEKRIAKNYNITEFNIFELALLYADVNQKTKSIKQKFRFNKMLFYIGKELENIYGTNTLIFDEMVAARSGPIPLHLKEDIERLQQDGIIDIFLEKNGKKVPGSKQDWLKMKGPESGSIVCALTKKGEEIAKGIWKDLDLEIKDVIVKVKQKLFYTDTEVLREKVHEEYPEYKKTYVENDIETFEYFM